MAEIESQKDTGRGAESKATSKQYLLRACFTLSNTQQGTFYNSRDDDQDQLQLI